MKYPPAVVLAIAALLSTTACDTAPASAAASRDQPLRVLTGGAESLGGLAAGIVSALAADDSAALEAFRLTEAEHNEILWPEFPVAQQQGHEFPVHLAWENIHLRNSAGLARLLAIYGGAEIRSGGISCAGATDDFPTFTVLRDCRVTVVTPAGDARELLMFRSVVVRDGRYKIVRYEREFD